ncbi:MAG: MOSC domain-containing protein [Vulcanimicrobiaceae bacterium]
MPSSAQNVLGSVVALWRYPIKSMMGEELNASDVTEHGLLGDRAYALIDSIDGKVASAKNPRKWPHLFDFRAALADAPSAGVTPSVRITLPDGEIVTSDRSDVDQVLSRALERDVTLHGTKHRDHTAEEYWPDIEGLDHQDTVTDFDLPAGTFFDTGFIHVLSTATLDRLRELYPQGRFDARRFRPNIIMDSANDAKDFVENDWIGHTLVIGEAIRLRITGACPRCVMTTLAQGDLPKDNGILRTAAQYNKANVGVYASALQTGKIRRGDTVTLE